MSNLRDHSILKGITGFLLALGCTLSVFSFSGCGASKNVTKGEKEVLPPAEAPEWVGSRPHNGAYYIGIGSCSKVSQPLDYQTIAKKNALNDLASEISVRVQGQTFLNSLEVNKNFSEEFISTISTSTDEKIEDFEVAGLWETKTEYWTYYRLNKATYQQQKREKKNQALSAAYDYYQKGKSAEDLANIPVAFDLYMHGLFAMKNYWSEVNEFSTESGNVYLDNEIYAAMQRICDGMVLSSNIQKIVLASGNSYNQDAELSLTYQSKPVKGVSVSWVYQKDTYMKPKINITSDQGKVIAHIGDASTTAQANALEVNISLEPLLAADLDRTIQNGLIKTMKTESLSIPIVMEKPSFFIHSEEKNYGANATGGVLSSALSSELVKKGMRINQNDQETDYIVNISSNTTEGGSSQGFVVAFLEMTVVVKNSRNNQVVYQETLSSIKGLQLNKDAASMEAYKKGKEKIEQQVMKSILDAIM